MKRTLRENITTLPYNLHDMHVTGLIVDGNDIILQFKDGIYQNMIDGERVKGEIRFHKADRDFCFAYVLDFCGNEGTFTGRKQFLADFAEKNKTLDFEIIDETYGYNSSRFAGWLWSGEKPKECVLELYHFGSMEYITKE